MLELLVLRLIIDDYDCNKNYHHRLSQSYDLDKLEDRYYKLGKEFLTPYALNNTEKSD